jgi:hypothetical protein
MPGVRHSETTGMHTFNCLPETAGNNHGYFVRFWRDGGLVGVEEVENIRHHAHQAASMIVFNTPSMALVYRRLLAESFVNANGEVVDSNGDLKVKTFPSIDVDLNKMKMFWSDPSLRENGFNGCQFTAAELVQSGRTATQSLVQVTCAQCNTDSASVCVYGQRYGNGEMRYSNHYSPSQKIILRKLWREMMNAKWRCTRTGTSNEDLGMREPLLPPPPPPVP